MVHYYDEEQTSEIHKKEFSYKFSGFEFKFISASGIFSLGSIDRGTEVLLESMKIYGTDILDLGCGYGAVGIIVKKIFKLNVDLCDVNNRALMIARDNCNINGVSCPVYYSNGFSKIPLKYDVILFNPPQSAGKKICFKMVLDSKMHLKPNGSLQLVCRHNKGGREFEKYMKEVFGNVSVLGKGSGYRVYASYLN